MMIGQESGPLKLEKVLKSIGCPHSPRAEGDKYAIFSNDSYTCLRNVSIERLMKAQDEVIGQRRDLGFYPIADGDFFPAHPYDSLKVRGQRAAIF